MVMIGGSAILQNENKMLGTAFGELSECLEHRGKLFCPDFGLIFNYYSMFFHKLPFKAEESKRMWKHLEQSSFYEIWCFIFRIHAKFGFYVFMFVLI